MGWVFAGGLPHLSGGRLLHPSEAAWGVRRPVRPTWSSLWDGSAPGLGFTSVHGDLHLSLQSTREPMEAEGWLPIPGPPSPAPEPPILSLLPGPRNQCSCHFQGMDYPPGDTDIPALGHW